ncbi:MAG: arylamine N-acetyltransferase, partial [Clostridiales Family XIII bacterium]|nr:arylamine N-acetyltransferase [Clostridiales Family XIII bacterium]
MEPDAANASPYAALYRELDDDATAAYLARIRATRPARPDREALNALILAHQLAVPFENLDIFAGRPVSLAVGDIADKMIRRRRGGYCFELNAGFYSLLRALGYDAFPIAGGVVLGEGEPPPPHHRATAVRLDGCLLYCDVGFGGPMPGAA